MGVVMLYIDIKNEERSFKFSSKMIDNLELTVIHVLSLLVIK